MNIKHAAMNHWRSKKIKFYPFGIEYALAHAEVNTVSVKLAVIDEINSDKSIFLILMALCTITIYIKFTIIISDFLSITACVKHELKSCLLLLHQINHFHVFIRNQIALINYLNWCWGGILIAQFYWLALALITG